MQPSKPQGHSKGSGGSWRAFIKVKSSGKKGRANFKALSSEYAKVQIEDAEGFAFYRDMGASATAAAKARPSSKKSAFGRKSKELHRRALKRVAEQLWQAETTHTATARASDILNHARVVGKPLSYAVKMAEAVRRQEAAAISQEEADDIASIQEFENTIGKQHLQDLVALVPALKPLDCKVLPSAGVRMLHVGQDIISQGVSTCGWALQHPETTLGKSLSESWVEQHVVVEPAQCHPLLHGTKPTSKCYVAGHCLCSLAGKELQKVHGRLMRLLRQEFGVGEAKKELEDGKVVLHLSDYNRAGGAHEPSNMAMNDIAHVDLFWGIPLMYFKPYRPTLEILKEIENPEPWIYSGISAADVIYVEAKLSRGRGSQTPSWRLFVGLCVGKKGSSSLSTSSVIPHTKQVALKTTTPASKKLSHLSPLVHKALNFWCLGGNPS